MTILYMPLLKFLHLRRNMDIFPPTPMALFSKWMGSHDCKCQTREKRGQKHYTRRGSRLITWSNNIKKCNKFKWLDVRTAGEGIFILKSGMRFWYICHPFGYISTYIASKVLWYVGLFVMKRIVGNNSVELERLPKHMPLTINMEFIYPHKPG